MLVHSTAREFVCEVEGCTYAFKTKGSLRRHMRRHTGTSLSHIAEQIWVYTREFVRCRDVHMPSRLKALRRHLRRHTGTSLSHHITEQSGSTPESLSVRWRDVHMPSRLKAHSEDIRDDIQVCHCQVLANLENILVCCLSLTHFLAHLSQRLSGELIG